MVQLSNSGYKHNNLPQRIELERSLQKLPKHTHKARSLSLSILRPAIYNNRPVYTRKRYVSHWNKMKSQSAFIKQENKRAVQKFTQSTWSRYKMKMEFKKMEFKKIELKKKQRKRSSPGDIHKKRGVKDPLLSISNVSKTTSNQFSNSKLKETLNLTAEPRKASRAILAKDVNISLQHVSQLLSQIINAGK